MLPREKKQRLFKLIYIIVILFLSLFWYGDYKKASYTSTSCAINLLFLHLCFAAGWSTHHWRTIMNNWCRLLVLSNGSWKNPMQWSRLNWNASHVQMRVANYFQYLMSIMWTNLYFGPGLLACFDCLNNNTSVSMYHYTFCQCDLCFFSISNAKSSIQTSCPNCCCTKNTQWRNDVIQIYMKNVFWLSD